ncbi:hypothetical protein [Clostridium gasigenes]|uniref:hypothetical protein n=1 Tax=Clostridium gasigenes TaxID=94869 RepID=UPI001C0B495A|nr:hypothetical protein [Clostridium gasigenes]MBU3106420.1 hypothetical protein [Clostridium gasigenes]
MDDIIKDEYKIADKYEVILKGNIKINSNVNCLVFAHYCEDTLFYKHLFKVSKDILKVNRKSKNNLKEIKELIKISGYKKVWTKGVFSVYGDLRPLAVEAKLGTWGNNGIIENEEYGSNFLISAIFYK